MQTVRDRLEYFFDSIEDNEVESYSNYWETIKPKNKIEIFRRYLFAFMSVHTTWENNCKGYKRIRDFSKWRGNSEKLREKINKARVGLHNNRTNFIGRFADSFWSSPSEYISPNSSEGWVEWRNRLAKKILGLGSAKTSFAIEMLFPNDAKVACMDTHLFQMYNLNQTKDRKLYEAIEHDWVERSAKRNIAPYMARCIYWDRKQNRKNSRYWSKVLEN